MDIIEIKTKITKEINEQIKLCSNINQLLEMNRYFVGKNGIITELMKEIKNLENEEKKEFGQMINDLKSLVINNFEDKKHELESSLEDKNKIDVTADETFINSGSIHPITKIIEEAETIFSSMGYDIVEGPEVEWDKYNFEMLNLPIGHPARDSQDSFYITDNYLLRTHTSPVQIRTMLSNKEKTPIRIVCPGKVYRRDDDDATHSHQFTQIEGLLIDENISLSHLKATLEEFVAEMFDENRQIRFRPSFFPFTEPSIEADVSCFLCKGKGCNVCKQSGWIEVFGAGMVHPNVLTMAGYDANKYQGFAFGIGIERIAMLKYGINDIRNFYTNDLRFLNDFNRKEGDK